MIPTIGYLRQRFPTWTWSAVRNGWGWAYDGTWLLGHVRIYACAVLIGDDSSETRWYAAEGDSVDTFGMWCLRFGAGGEA